MKIDDQLLLHLERLARLKLSDSERGKMKDDLSKILGLCQQLDNIDTTGVEPLIYLGAKSQSPRVDQVDGMVDDLSALSNAPNAVNGHFAIPKVLKK